MNRYQKALDITSMIVSYHDSHTAAQRRTDEFKDEYHRRCDELLEHFLTEFSAPEHDKLSGYLLMDFVNDPRTVWEFYRDHRNNIDPVFDGAFPTMCVRTTAKLKTLPDSRSLKHFDAHFDCYINVIKNMTKRPLTAEEQAAAEKESRYNRGVSA